VTLSLTPIDPKKEFTLSTLQKITRRMAAAVVASCFLPLTGWAADDAAHVRAIVDGHAYFANYGVASRADKKPVTSGTLFELGSVSKTFTATLASYAQGEGKLALDDHPGKYMPLLKGHPIDQATLLNLGTYTAGGLPLQFPEDLTDPQMTTYFQNWKPDAAPGVQRRYSNPSIGLLGHLAGLALQRDAGEAMEQQLFPQLGLKSTWIVVPDKAMVNYAQGYTDENKPIRVSPGVLATGAYGVKSTASDMLRYVQANIAPEQLTGPMRGAVNGTHVGYFEAPVGGMVQGLGWEQYAWPVTLDNLLAGNGTPVIRQANAVTAIASPRIPAGPTLYNKTGSTNGFGAYVVFVPAQKIGIVLLANKAYPNADRIKAAYAIMEQLTGVGAPPAMAQP
jgi:beta-lactamase class C